MKWLWFFIFCTVANFVFGQFPKDVKIHSHNDYAQEVPFQAAFESGVASIEIDVFLKDKMLYVTHSEIEIVDEHDIESLYFRPLRDAIYSNPHNLQKLQFLIDLKSEAIETIAILIKILERYPDLIQNANISFVISGNTPLPQDYTNFPEYLLFDYQRLEALEDPRIWKKIALISLPFRRYSKWQGVSEIPPKEYETILNIVNKAKEYGRPFRFWGTPDTEIAWKTFAQIGVDYINTDKPAECAKYFRKLD